MSKWLRVGGAIVAGLAVALVLVIAVEAFSAVVHPFPPEFDGSMEQTCAHVARYPQWVLALVVPMWGFTIFLSTWLTGRIGNRDAAAFVGLLLVLGVAFNVWKLPYPFWFKPTMLVTALIIAAATVRRLPKRHATPSPPAAT